MGLTAEARVVTLFVALIFLAVFDLYEAHDEIMRRHKYEDTNYLGGLETPPA